MLEVNATRLRRNAGNLKKSSSEYRPSWGDIENASTYRSILLSLDMEAAEVDFSSFTLNELEILIDIYLDGDYQCINSLTDDLDTANFLWHKLSSLLKEKAVAIDASQFI